MDKRKEDERNEHDTVANRGYYVMTTDTIQTISITDFHAHVGETINRVHFSQQPIIITNRREPYAIILPLTYVAKYGGLELMGMPVDIDKPEEQPKEPRDDHGQAIHTEFTPDSE
jgi:hypothetical protein